MLDCPLSPVQIFMDFLGRQGPEEVQFGKHRSTCLLFSDDFVLLTSSNQDLQHVLGWFGAECEAAGMRTSTSKSMTWLSTGEGWFALSRLMEKSYFGWRSSANLGSCSQVRERWSMILTGRLVQKFFVTVNSGNLCLGCCDLVPVKVDMRVIIKWSRHVARHQQSLLISTNRHICSLDLAHQHACLS